MGLVSYGSINYFYCNTGSAYVLLLVLCKAREMVLPEMERHGPIEAWIIDDTAFPKQGRHSVGVGRQYCGQLGKQENCQAAVSVSNANHHASLPVCYRFYLPQDWAGDACHADARPAYRRISSSRPSRRSLSIRSAGPWRTDCRPVLCWRMWVTATTASGAPRSAR